MECPKCGAAIPKGQIFCDYCGTNADAKVVLEEKKTAEQLNKIGCPRCGSSNVTFSREKLGEVKGKNGMAVVRATIGVCKDCGHTWQTDAPARPPRKRNTALWVWGWILCWPIPLTVIIARNKKLNKGTKAGIIGALWGIPFLFVIIVGLTASETSQPIEQSTTVIESQVDTDDDASGDEISKDSSKEEETQIEESDSEKDLKDEIKEKYGLVWFGDVRNDVTGNWRYSMYASGTSVENIAVDYYNAYFESDDEIHAVINTTLGTTASIKKSSLSDDLLYVTVFEYQDGEEHDAKELFGGMKLADYEVTISTGEIEKIDNQ